MWDEIKYIFYPLLRTLKSTWHHDIFQRVFYFYFQKHNQRPTRELRRRSKIRKALKDDFVSSWESDEDEKDQELNSAIIASLGPWTVLEEQRKNCWKHEIIFSLHLSLHHLMHSMDLLMTTLAGLPVCMFFMFLMFFPNLAWFYVFSMFLMKKSWFL